MTFLINFCINNSQKLCHLQLGSEPMQHKFQKPSEEIIYNLARFGLIHKYRQCWFCQSRMVIVRRENDIATYIWECTLCHFKMKLTKNTPLNGISLRSVDQSLEMWLIGATGKITKQIASSSKSDKTMFKVFRKACAKYFSKRIAPYIVLPGPVEIDEAQVGAKRFWLFPYQWPECRWMFGMICRLTKIPVIYYIPNKKHCNLINFIKPHVAPGTIMFSDEHSSYVATQNGLRSKLAFYGYYHYWINHSRFYVHEKFNFVHTSRIESTWNDIRHVHNALKMQMDGIKIQEYCDSYSIRKMTKPHKQYDFVLKCMHLYFLDMYHEYLEVQKMKDDYWPNIEMIDKTNKMLKIKSIANVKNIVEDGKRYVVANDDTVKSRFHLRKLHHHDLEDCLMPINEYDMEYTILSKHFALKRRREKKVLNLQVFIPVSKVLTVEEPFDYDFADLKAQREKSKKAVKQKDKEESQPNIQQNRMIAYSADAIAVGASNHTTFRDFDISSMKFNKSYRDYLKKLYSQVDLINFEEEN